MSFKWGGRKRCKSDETRMSALCTWVHLDNWRLRKCDLSLAHIADWLWWFSLARRQSAVPSPSPISSILGVLTVPLMNCSTVDGGWNGRATRTAMSSNGARWRFSIIRQRAWHVRSVAIFRNRWIYRKCFHRSLFVYRCTDRFRRWN